MDGLGHLRGWQWLFIIEGCLTVIYGVILKVSTQSTGCLCLLDTAAGPWAMACVRRHSSCMRCGQPTFRYSIIVKLRVWPGRSKLGSVNAAH